MTDPPSKHIVLANGAKGPKGTHSPLQLHYIDGYGNQIVRIGLPKFVKNVFHLSPRILDLLEIAGYVFAADRLISRGPKDALEYHAWSRSIQFHIRVRDYDFWSQPYVRAALSQTLEFMTGDSAYSFTFESGHSTPPTSLFDQPGFLFDTTNTGINVTLFSGGLDSLCGALELLEATPGKIILISHQSQSGTIHTQNALVAALQIKYPRRVFHYQFECTLRGIRAREETQRTRAFLYTSIAFAIASAYGEYSFNVYENGITSVNLRRREDLANARASRTTHPQTIGKMAKLFSMITDRATTIQLPFLYKTKSDIIKRLRELEPNFLSSAVSCTRTFQTVGQATHCGQCFQCIDRRIAAHAADAESLDHRGLYTHDVISNKVEDRETRTTLVDYIRQGLSFSDNSAASFEDEYLTELAELLDYINAGQTDVEKVDKLWDLFRRHGSQVKTALTKIRQLYDDLSKPVQEHSILDIISSREYLKPQQQRLANTIAAVISSALRDMFAHYKPKDEPDLNSKLSAVLRSHNSLIQSEHPTVSFACSRVVPDHLWPNGCVLVEAKYIRRGTSPSKATEGIAADLTKFPEDAFILFVVYDPQSRVPSGLHP